MRTRSGSGHALAVGLLAGTAADAVFGDPQRGHPVAGFGHAAGLFERRIYRDSRASGVLFTACLVGGAVGLGSLAERAVGRRGYPVLVAGATWAVLGAESLRREANVLNDLIETDIPAARRRLGHLAGRDATLLDAAEIARAGVESVAENSSDAVLAPLLWGAVLGVPGLLGYRAANTLDAMVGHKTERYRQFGWASARLDDAVNLVPARVTAAVTVAAAPLVGGSPRSAAAACAAAFEHPSPNSGWPEAAFAGALGLRLGGTNTYASGVEHRPVLGTGRAVVPGDLPRAARLARAVAFGGAVLAAAVACRR